MPFFLPAVTAAVTAAAPTQAAISSATAAAAATTAGAAGGTATVGNIIKGVNAVAGVQGVSQQQRAIKLQEQSAKASENLGKFESKRRRRAQVRASIIRQAEVQQAASNTGVAGSSSEIGAIGNIASTSASNQAYISSSERAVRSISSQNQGANNAISRGNLAGSVGKLTEFGAANQLGVQSYLNNLFST